MKKFEPMVSIICMAYNHEKYIRQCLDGFVMQKTDFIFEVLIHDDASTDGTADIIREYESLYPDIIKPIYQKENQHSQGIRIIEVFIFPLIKGKYLAWCEGDDYWSDPNKLQKQYDTMEKNFQCAICFHKTRIISENGDPTESFFPRYTQMRSGIIDKETYLSLVLFTRTLYQLQFQLSSVMVQTKFYRNYIYKNPFYKSIMDVGDLPFFLYMGLCGDAYYIDSEMSCYRKGAVNSWNQRHNDIQKKVSHFEKEIEGLKAFDQFSEQIVHENVKKGIDSRRFAIYRANGNLAEMKKLKEIYKMLSYKDRLKYYLSYYFTNFYSFLKKYRIIH